MKKLTSERYTAVWQAQTIDTMLYKNTSNNFLIQVNEQAW